MVDQQTPDQNSQKTPKKKAYTTIVVESPMQAPRTDVWTHLLQLVESATTDEFGREMSNEPPWRYVYSRETVATALCECSVTMRDDGESCNLAWAALIDPLPDGASDQFIGTVRSTFEGYVEQLQTTIADTRSNG